MKVLVTGGAGYIGSHTIVELLNNNHRVVVIDNFANSKPGVIQRLEEITGQSIPLYQGDVSDKAFLRKVLSEQPTDVVMHFAGLKAVGESVKNPLAYYRNNIDSTLSLCEVMQEKGVRKLVFSSSAVVYGEPEALPLQETSRTGLGITNPYGQTKYMIEQVLRDLISSDPSWLITALRYFNPIGAHQSGLIGEDPRGIPNNLVPYASQVAIGKLDKLLVFGNDYDTPDGTGVRDYIHVVDLAKGHVAALGHLRARGHMEVYNLGVGKGVSVLQIIHAFQRASGKAIPYQVVARRPGDIASCYADVSKAKTELGWKAEKTLEDACVDTWRWQSRNPRGYDSI